MNGATSSNTGKYPKPAGATSAATPSSWRSRYAVGRGSPISAPGEGRASVGGQSRPAGDGAPEPPHTAWPAVPAPTRSVPGHPQGGHRSPLYVCGQILGHLFADLDRPADQAPFQLKRAFPVPAQPIADGRHWQVQFGCNVRSGGTFDLGDYRLSDRLDAIEATLQCCGWELAVGLPTAVAATAWHPDA